MRLEMNMAECPNTKRIRTELLEALEQFPPTTYDMDGLMTQRAGCEFLREHSEYLPTSSSVRIYNKEISVMDNEHLRLRIYEPINLNGNYPCVIWIHGGGMALGIPEADEGQSIRFVEEVGCIVVSIDYRLAPENPYPIPLNDCYYAFEWVVEHADELHINPDRIALAGASGGGGLALALALRCRDQKGPKPSYIMALTPMINRALDTPIASEVFDSRTLNRDGAELLWSYYLKDNKDTDIYMEPIKDDFHGLPPVYTAAGELDPFRDDTICLAAKLMAQHVPTELHIYPGTFHISESIAPNAEISIYQVGEYVRALKENLCK